MENRQNPIEISIFGASAEIMLNQWVKGSKARKPLQMLALQHAEHLTARPSNVVKYKYKVLNILSFSYE